MVDEIKSDITEVEKKHHEELLNRITKAILSSSLARNVSAIVISGSFGRNEPTFHYNQNDEIIYDSDMELVLVYSSWRDMLSIKKQSHIIIDQFPEIELEILPISAARLVKCRNHNFSWKIPRYKTLFTYDFYNGSRTLWGKDYLKEIVNIDKVDTFEGKRIIANRLCELIYIRNSKASSVEVNRWLAKIILAIGSAYLLENKTYKSSYKQQFETIQKDKMVSDFLGDCFIRDYTAAFNFLRAGKNELSFLEDEPSIKEYVRIMNNYYLEKHVVASKTNSLYIIVREALLLIKFDWKKGRYIFNPKNYIFQGMLSSYLSDEKNMTYWSDAWKRVLN